jgi:hypothetical protein
MDSKIFKQFEEQFGKEWGCACGSSFDSSRVDIVSRTKNSMLAKYSCQICGREQMFAVSVGAESKLVEAPKSNAPKGALSSDDVLDIKNEIAKITLPQARLLSRKKVKSRLPSPRFFRN